MGFFFQDDYWEGVEYLPDNQKKDFVFAVVSYYFTGKEPALKREAMGQFVQIKKRINMARKEADRKRTSRGQTKDKTRTDCGQNADKSRTLLNKEGEGYIDIPNGISPPIVPQRDTSFWVSCLAVLNETLGTTYTTMPEKCRHMLERSSAAYTPEDVRKMIVYKRDEWREKDRKSKTSYSKNLTPNTLFSPDHFEQYMHQSKDAKEANDYAKYDRS